MRKSGLLLLALPFIIISCQKEVNEIIAENEPACRVTMGHYYGGGGMHDSARFTYDASGRLVSWENMDGEYVYTYDGDRIRTRVYRENSGQVWNIDSVRYNADNTISEIVYYDVSGTYGPDTIHTKVIFFYDGSRVSQTKTVDYYDYGMGPETDTTTSTFTWSATGNIEKIRFVNTGYMTFDDSVLYRYDNNPNYFKAIHPHFFLFDPELQLQTGFETQLAFFYSRNNVSNINVYGTWDYPISYGIDSTNKVTSLDMGGFPYVSYEYECD
jgi:hypothetical protein